VEGADGHRRAADGRLRADRRVRRHRRRAVAGAGRRGRDDRLLDPETGGSFGVCPAVPYRAERRYLPGTSGLETTFTTDGGQVRVTDAVTRGVAGLLSWPELAREVRGVRGEVPMRWRVTPGTRLRRVRPWASCAGRTPLLRVGDQAIAVVADGAGESRTGRAEVSGEFTARPGRDALLALAAADRAPLAVPRPAHVRARLRGWRSTELASSSIPAPRGCSRTWPDGCATCGPSPTRASGNWTRAGTTRSPRSPAGRHSVGRSGSPNAARCLPGTSAAGASRRRRSGSGPTSTAGRPPSALMPSTPVPTTWTPASCCRTDRLPGRRRPPVRADHRRRAG
jgi:hypothetical protein